MCGLYPAAGIIPAVIESCVCFLIVTDERTTVWEYSLMAVIVICISTV